MSWNPDDWCKEALGVDVGGELKKLEAAATGAIQQGQAAITALQQGADNLIQQGVAAVKKAVAPSGAGAKAGAAGGSSGGGAAGSATGGSVGQGGTNNSADVKAVQAALGIAADGKCGPQTIKAIEDFQRSIGQSRPDGRIDPGGPTMAALMGGGKAAPGPAPAPAGGDDDDSGGFLGRLKKGAEDLADDAKELGDQLLKGVEGGLGGGGSLPSVNPSGGGASNSLLGLIESYGGELTFAEKSLFKKPLGKYFELEVKVSGSVKFGGSKAGLDKPSKLEVEQGVLKFVESVFAEGVANFKTETGAGIKPNATKAGRGIGIGGAVAFKTNFGPVTLEFATFEISLVNFDAKKKGLDSLSGPKVIVGTSRSLGHKSVNIIKGVELEIAVAVTLSSELTPNYISIAADVAKNLLEVTAEEAILITIDAAAVAGVPLAVAAIIGISIFSAGERGARDSAIIEGAIDTKKAAFDYAFTMTGNPAGNPGPRAKAAVAVAKAQLAKIASGRKISLEELMTELRNDKNAGKDLARFHQQARNQFFAAYHARVRNVIIDWRKDHSVQAFLTDETDDIISIGKKVDVIFAT